MYPGKKRKLDEYLDKRAIIFENAGLGEPDARIRVFNQEFRVHSIVLKQHSDFFRVFLDSPDKESAPESTAFRYDYVSVVDEDGEWGLESAAKATKNQCSLQKELKASKEEEAFHYILKAMYSQPHSIDGVDELDRITTLADFYRALPIVSLSLNTAFWQSPELLKDLRGSPKYRVLGLAKKLRNSLLFRETFIYVVSEQLSTQTKTPIMKSLTLGSDVMALLESERVRISKLVSQMNNAILLNSGLSSELGTMISGCLSSEWVESHTLDARYYRNLYNKLRAVDWSKADMSFESHSDRVVELLEEIIPINTLTHLYDPSTHIRSPDLVVEDEFLCAEIPDDLLPWDTKATTW